MRIYIFGQEFSNLLTILRPVRVVADDLRTEIRSSIRRTCIYLKVVGILINFHVFGRVESPRTFMYIVNKRYINKILSRGGGEIMHSDGI